MGFPPSQSSSCLISEFILFLWWWMHCGYPLWFCPSRSATNYSHMASGQVLSLGFKRFVWKGKHSRGPEWWKHLFGMSLNKFCVSLNLLHTDTHILVSPTFSFCLKHHTNTHTVILISETLKQVCSFLCAVHILHPRLPDVWDRVINWGTDSSLPLSFFRSDIPKTETNSVYQIHSYSGYYILTIEVIRLPQPP